MLFLSAIPTQRSERKRNDSEETVLHLHQVMAEKQGYNCIDKTAFIQRLRIEIGNEEYRSVENETLQPFFLIQSIIGNQIQSIIGNQILLTYKNDNDKI